MCGRYVSPSVADAERSLTVDLLHWSNYQQSYNVAPTQPVPVVRMLDGRREGLIMRWGLIPFFARGEPPKYSTINARIETVQTAASYRGPWQRGQRCLQLAGGFYEWHLDERSRKAPYYIHLADQPVFAFAGLWDRSKRSDGATIESVVHITLPANDLLQYIHNTGNNPHRMPAILSRSDINTWLTGSTEEAFACLKPYSADCMAAWEVSAAVNRPKNNNAALLEPKQQLAAHQPSVHLGDQEPSMSLPLADPQSQ